jgi:mono/diheme cytochrome c family protein
MIDRITGTGIRPYTSFGAIPLLPEPGADRLIAPDVAYDPQIFAGQTRYPIEMALHLPLTKPLYEGKTAPTGWVGYVHAEAADPVPGQGATHSWVGFNCAACHAARVTYQYEPGGKRVTQIFAGIPNPDWKATFLTLSGRTYGLSVEEALPPTFLKFDYPAGTQQRLGELWSVRGANFLERLGAGNQRSADPELLEHSKQAIDKTLLMYNIAPGSTESTMFVPSSDPGDYANDYFFSPQAIPIISNHTPVRRALSRSELIDGFEGAYLHGEEPEGARGPMSSRSLQDLTLYTSTLRQSDELLRRVGLYRWLNYKGKAQLLGGTSGQPVNEGTFVSYLYPQDELLQPSHFPPMRGPSGGLGSIRDAALADPSGARALADPFAQRFPELARHIVAGSLTFARSCGRCHTPGNAGTWTNEDMQPLSAAGGTEPVGRFFSPTVWQRRVQSIRTAILENLFWVQRRGLLSDGHVMSDAQDNMDGLEMLVDPARCRAPVGPDGSVDLDHASDLYRRLYTVHQGAGHSFRVPSAGMRFEFTTQFGDPPGMLRQVVAPKPDRLVTEAEGRFVERHAYFTRRDDGYYYWDYQKMRREYGELEFGLDPKDPEQRARIGGLPAAPHPWCLSEDSTRQTIDDLVTFLLTL